MVSVGRRRAVVTGGAGFIGSHLVDRLLREGHSVTVIDSFATGRIDNIAHHQGNGDLRVVRADVADFETILPVFRGAEWLFHLAALADIVPSIQRPLDYHRSNVTGTASVFEAARLSSVKRCVYVASSSCYGIPDIYPTSEDAPIQPQYPYALSKYLGEQIALHWCQAYKLPVVSLRFFNVYGPRSRTTGAYGAVFGVFLAQKLAGKPYTIVGDGTQTRDFTFVTDVVAAVVRAAESDVSGQVMNVGSGATYRVNDLVGLLGGDAIHIPKRPGEPDCTFADTSKIRRLLGWAPQVTFEDGVRIMLKNIEYWRTAPVWTPEKIADATKEWFEFLTPSRAGAAEEAPLA